MLKLRVWVKFSMARNEEVIRQLRGLKLGVIPYDKECTIMLSFVEIDTHFLVLT